MVKLLSSKEVSSVRFRPPAPEFFSLFDHSFRRRVGVCHGTDFSSPICLNLILFEAAEISLPLPRDDRRAQHLVEVLRRQAGDTFDAGIVNGPRGRGTIARVSDRELLLEFSWGSDPPAHHPLTLIVGLPRPQTARAILREVTSLGVSDIHFVTTEKGESNYAQSTLWRTGEWRRHLLAGAEQAFCTRIPEVTSGHSLLDALSTLPSSGMQRVALDNYEATLPVSKLTLTACTFALAVGPERGWSAKERNLLRTNGFELAHIGSRVLRTETACIAAVSLIKAKIGSM